MESTLARLMNLVLILLSLALNIPCLLMNVMVFPKLERNLGCVRTYCLSAFVLFLTTIAIPFINELCGNP